MTQASQVIAWAAVPVSQAAPSLPPAEAPARCAAHCACTTVTHCSCSTESPSMARSSANETCTTALTGCPARSGSRSAAISRRIASWSAS